MKKASDGKTSLAFFVCAYLFIDLSAVLIFNRSVLNSDRVH